MSPNNPTLPAPPPPTRREVLANEIKKASANPTLKIVVLILLGFCLGRV